MAAEPRSPAGAARSVPAGTPARHGGAPEAATLEVRESARLGRVRAPLERLLTSSSACGTWSWPA
eukprot:766043-Lingulodinium_polyedra.AAC.1